MKTEIHRNIHNTNQVENSTSGAQEKDSAMHKSGGLAQRLVAMGLAGFMFASCAREKPVLTDLEQLKGPQGTELVDKRVALNVSAKFLKEVDDSYWYQPPPLIFSDGKNITAIPQVGYEIKDTDYLYSVTVERAEKEPFCVGTVQNENPVPEGDSFLITKFLGLDNEGNIKFCGGELLSPAGLKAELEEK